MRGHSRTQVTIDALAAVGLVTVTVFALGTVVAAGIGIGQGLERWWQARNRALGGGAS